MSKTCISLNFNSEAKPKVIDFPVNLMPIRLAQANDIKGIIELWANSATMRYFFDSTRWNWKGKASEVWGEHALELLKDKNKFLLICDFQDNGLSGFLTARLDELPNYYEHKYSLTIDEFYLRPKDKKLSIFKEMIKVLLDEVYRRLGHKASISLKIEILDSDNVTEELLQEAGLKKSSATYTISLS